MLGEHPAGGAQLRLGQPEGVPDDVEDPRAAGVHCPAGDVGHPQTRSGEQLLDHVWGFDFDPGSNVVDVYVGYLRRKFGADAIETVRGMGYRFRP